MIPKEEIRALALTTADAFDLAAEGSYTSGYYRLLAALERAEGARDVGQPWGAELVSVYQLVLNRYREHAPKEPPESS
jgi:hypothetical protein